jgi:hypothetical protein
VPSWSDTCHARWRSRVVCSTLYRGGKFAHLSSMLISGNMKPRMPRLLPLRNRSTVSQFVKQITRIISTSFPTQSRKLRRLKSNGNLSRFHLSRIMLRALFLRIYFPAVLCNCPTRVWFRSAGLISISGLVAANWRFSSLFRRRGGQAARNRWANCENGRGRSFVQRSMRIKAVKTRHSFASFLPSVFFGQGVAAILVLDHGQSFCLMANRMYSNL